MLDIYISAAVDVLDLKKSNAWSLLGLCLPSRDLREIFPQAEVFVEPSISEFVMCLMQACVYVNVSCRLIEKIFDLLMSAHP
jgi:hypothetical protein